ncbi:MAG: endonuclease/exonuclease/phosphatase family protein [Verrucomicrobiaceae bacterium]|nr:endonuclease/exonuclease/phosphatase family protein [Verrucomicrobiaceae bacterium]
MILTMDDPNPGRSWLRCESSLRIQAALRIAVLLFVCIRAGAQEQSAAPAGTFTFCSYNLKNWLAMDRFDGEKTVSGASKPEDEKAAVVAIITAIHPDVLGVCEIGGDSDLKDLQKRLADRGLKLPNWTVAHGGDTTRRLGLLTRFPITATNHQTDLKYQIGELTMQFQRGILDATVKITENWSLRCMGVHLKSMRPVPEADQALMRRNEAHLLRKHLDQVIAAAPGTGVVLYGDFNEHRNEAAIDEILGSAEGGAAMTEVKVWDRAGEVWTHFWDAADSYARIDYFFVSDPVRNHIDFKRSFVYSRREFYKASDHRPIVMNISVEPLEK